MRIDRISGSLLVGLLVCAGLVMSSVATPDEASVSKSDAKLDAAGAPKSVATHEQAEAPEKVRAEFRAIADALARSENPYPGNGDLWWRTVAEVGEDELGLVLSDPSTPPAKRIETLEQLGYQRLFYGNTDGAVATLEEALALLEEHPLPVADANRVRSTAAQAYLRQAEVRNCIERHNGGCCVFPLEGGGVHQREEPARRALELYVPLAGGEENPNLQELWLCNVLAMALGEHPDALPAHLRIPPEAFESEYDVGRFEDVAPALGVDVFGLSGGAIIEDFDGDGLLDIVSSNFDKGGPLTYFQNDARGGFEDRSRASGLDSQLCLLHCVSGDYDNDGDADIMAPRGTWLMMLGCIRDSLLRNDGKGVFADVTRFAGIAEPAYPSQTAAFGDVDGDSFLDLYIGNEIVGKEDGVVITAPSQLFLNDGDGTFSPTKDATNDRFAKGVALGDCDNDGDLDMYVSNLQQPNRLYENDGEGHFRDVAPEKGLEKPIDSFATWFFDWNNDGWLDLFVTGFDAQVGDIAAHYLGLEERATRPALYENQRDGTFRDVARDVGLDRPLSPMGCSFGDLDGDGWLDMYLGTGNRDYRALMPNVCLRNDAARRFQDVTTSAGVGHLQKGHGVSLADLDDDGDADIYHDLGGAYPGDGFSNALFENPGHDTRFLYVDLEGRKSNRSGYGARIRVVVATPRGEREMHRAVGSVSSFGNTPFRQEIGLGDAESILALEVWWPTSGIRQRFENVPLDAFVRVTEGVDELERLPLTAIPFRTAKL